MSSYAVTAPRNSQTQHWRGKLRGYAVTRPSRVHACVCAWAGTCEGCMCACTSLLYGVPRNRVTA